ncbi:MAG: type II secretion system protein GspD, partial [Gammaproteobacteria bacterium]|nr:type II secretion system protein GspD [Gammaproteobacteria bacterium]
MNFSGYLVSAVLMCFALVLPVHAETVTLNLKDADISALISTVAEVSNKNFIVDPRVKGKVTVVSSQPMNSDEVYQVFLSILKVHGYAAVPSGEVIKIVPDVNAKQDGIPTT